MKKEIMFKVNEEDFAYATRKMINFCTYMENYANYLNYTPPGSSISIKKDTTIGHGLNVNQMIKTIDMTKELYIDGICRPFDEVGNSFSHKFSEKKIEELANYAIDFRTVECDTFLNDKEKSCKLFYDFVNHSEGIINAINKALNENNINNTGTNYSLYNDDEGYQVFVYHIVGNIDMVISITRPTVSDEIESERFSNCMRFIASLVIVGNTIFNYE